MRNEADCDWAVLLWFEVHQQRVEKAYESAIERGNGWVWNWVKGGKGGVCESKVREINCQLRKQHNQRFDDDKEEVNDAMFVYFQYNFITVNVDECLSNDE
jgi:hypothetical protein